MINIHRLEDIKEEIKELLDEAKQIIREADKIQYEMAKSTWMSHIIMALDHDHSYLGGSMKTMQDTIDSLDYGDDYDDDDDIEIEDE